MTWLEQLRRRMGLPKRKPTVSRTRLGIENLEDRFVPAFFAVTSTLDNTNAVITTGHAGTAADPFIAPSLRSAISAANATPGGNTIELTGAGTYAITIPGAGEDNNSTGDFDILPTGGDLTITNTSGGFVAVDGNHLDRVFDINPGFDAANPTAKFTVTMEGFTIRNGAVTDAVNADGPNASGGGIRDEGNASLTLTDLVVADNVATADGGGVVMENVVSVPWTLTLNNTTITGNHDGDAGGGIDVDGSGKLNVNAGSVISDNSCVNQGGGIWLDAIQAGTVFQTTTLNVTGATIADNSAGGQGGGIGNAGVGAVTIADSTITNNFTANAGGGYGDENAADTLTVNNTVFSGNAAGQTGGGISFAGSTATITNSTFRGNSATGNGGGVFADKTTALQLTGDLVVGNSTAASGGGVSAAGTTVAIGTTEFRGNEAAVSGGGVFFQGGTLTLQAVTVADNTTAGNGGGVEFQGTGNGAQESDFVNVTIAGNSALNANGGTTGGGIDFPAADTTGGLVLQNVTISGNFANSGGGAFYAGTNTTVFALENTILAGNVAQTGPDANSTGAAFEDLGGNIVGNTSGSTGFTSTKTQTGVDPVLLALADNGGPKVGADADSITIETQAIRPGSPAVGRGLGTFATVTDERGFLRTLFAQSNVTDVGAFESAGLSPQVLSTVPTNGDANPYGVAFAPASFPTGGLIQPGDLLVSNFNNTTTQGLGTTLVRINPNGAPAVVFTSQQPGLTAALGFLKAGFVLVGNVPNVNGAPAAGGIQVLDNNGNLVQTITDPALLDGPWYLTVASDQGTSATVFVSNVLSGTVTRLDLQIANGAVTVAGKTQIASGYGHRLDNAAFVVGPAGLAYDAVNNLLYVASSVDDAIYQIGNPLTATTDEAT
jgi:hypothetical protein